MIPAFILNMVLGWLGPSKAKFAKPLIYGVAILIAVGGFFGLKALYDRSVVNTHEAKIEARAKPATDQAASERANDAIANHRHEEELHNAVHSVPDAPPAGPSHALACKRLHDLGRDPPACR